MFLDKKCSIFTTTIETIDCEQIKSYHSLYTDIACDYFVPNNKNNKYNKNNQAREFETRTLSLVLEWDKTLVKRWDMVELDNGYGKYVVDEYTEYKNIGWIIDNITLTITQRDVG